MRKLINVNDCLDSLLEIASAVSDAGQPTTECELLLAKMSKLVLELDAYMGLRLGTTIGLPERWSPEQVERNHAEREGTRF